MTAAEARRIVLQRAGGCCEDCGLRGARANKLGGGTGLEFHHVKGRRIPGAHRPENLRLLCSPCHDDNHRATNSLGRPRKPAGEKFVGKHLKFPPALWREVEETIPERQRTAFVREAVEDAIRLLEEAARLGIRGERVLDEDE